MLTKPFVNFDLDYCRCYYTKTTGCMASMLCLESIFSKTIRKPQNIRKNRIPRKAIKYGYVFNCRFWQSYSSYLVGDKNFNCYWGCNICRLKGEKLEHVCSHSGNICPIKLEDLNMARFDQELINIEIKDVSNVDQTISKIKSIFDNLTDSRLENIRIPKLFSLKTNQTNLVKKYATRIIYNNPVVNGNYLEFRFDNTYHEKIFESDPVGEGIIYPNKTAYIKINNLSDELKKYGLDNFENMFNLCPKDKHKIIIRNSEIEVCRHQQSYLKTPGWTKELLDKRSYMYSGFDTSKNISEIPELFKIYYDHIKKIDNRYNQLVVNWYKDGNDYIAPHGDCDIGMVPDYEISMISLYESDSDPNKYRILTIIPKNEKTESHYEKINIVLRHGTIITMGGTMQTEFKHGISKTESDCFRRISLSFRQFDEKSK